MHNYMRFTYCQYDIFTIQNQYTQITIRVIAVKLSSIKNQNKTLIFNLSITQLLFIIL